MPIADAKKTQTKPTTPSTERISSDSIRLVYQDIRETHVLNAITNICTLRVSHSPFRIIVIISTMIVASAYSCVTLAHIHHQILSHHEEKTYVAPQLNRLFDFAAASGPIADLGLSFSSSFPFPFTSSFCAAPASGPVAFAVTA